MRDFYYGDNRDLVKWGAVATALASAPTIHRIVQVAFWRPLQERYILTGGAARALFPGEVLRHFRDVHYIKRLGSALGVLIHPLIKGRKSLEKLSVDG